MKKNYNMLPLNGASKQENPDKGIKVGRAFASFVFPFVGAYTYLNEKDKKPEKAKKYGMLSLAGLALWASGVVAAKILKK